MNGITCKNHLIFTIVEKKIFVYNIMVLKSKKYGLKGKKMKSKYFRTRGQSKSYRMSKPRTLQIATRRNPNQILRFVVNQTYYYDGTKTASNDTAVLHFKANSIFQSQSPTSNISGEWLPQDPTLYSNYVPDAIQQNAEGWNEWSSRYQHFAVLGSKIQSTFEPTTTGKACVHFHHLSGVAGAITNSTTMADINKLPYTFRNSIVATTVQRGNTGSRMSQQYSGKKFEGVNNVSDNSNLRGSFAGAAPGELSHFYVGLAPVVHTGDPGGSNTLPQGVFRIKVEYIVLLKEPTESNNVQITSTAIPDHTEL